MALPSRNVEQTTANTPYIKTSVTAPQGATVNKTESTSRNATETMTSQNMDPMSMAALQNLIAILSSGGTPEQQAAEARRRQVQSITEQLLGQVSTGAAMNDAEAMMALQLQQAMEKSMPAIAKAIEGAGTSASSMQAVFSQQAARDAALASGALGGQMAAQYAGQRSNLANTLEALTRPQNEITNSLLRALETAKGASTTSTRKLSDSYFGSSSMLTQEGEKKQTDTYKPISSDTFAPMPTEATQLLETLAPTGRYTSTNSDGYWSNSGVPLSQWLTGNY